MELKYMTRKKLFYFIILTILLILSKLFIYDNIITYCKSQLNISDNYISSSSSISSSTSNSLRTSSLESLKSSNNNNNNNKEQQGQEGIQERQEQNELEIIKLKYNELNEQLKERNMINNIQLKMNEIEYYFEKTIRSCLGVKCFDMPANGVDRIGLLSPPGSGADIIFKYLKKLSTQIKSATFEIVHENNVPAYGYGKNHGWSRIIRIVRRPIPQTFQLLDEANLFQLDDISSLIDSQIRQLVRWHCRLSHVAAHTRMLTNDLILRPATIIEQILTYSGVNLPDRSIVLSLSSELRQEIIDYVSLYENTTQLLKKLPLKTLSTSNKLNSLLSLLEHAISAMKDDIISTKDLSMWPCRSFHSIEKVENLPISTNLIVSNCSSSWVTCGVDYDKKEFETAIKLQKKKSNRI